MSTSPLKVGEDSSMAIKKNGIVTILGSDLQQNRAASSLRRTLSADMSSHKWLAQNEISSMKRIASSKELAILDQHSSSSSSDGEDDDYEGCRFDDKVEKPKQFDNVCWGSIFLAEKTKIDDDSNNNVPPPPPYIHPLVKKSASTLSLKSLEICTESLGSETGSDGFSSLEMSDIEEADKEEDAPQIQQPNRHENEVLVVVESIEEDFPISKYNYNPGKKLLPRAFPPPLPSIARGDGASLQMQSRRENGRVVLEAVSIPQRNYFHAERHEGRLLLCLVNDPASQNPREEDQMKEDMVEELDEVFDNFEEVEEDEATEEEEKEEMANVMKKRPSLPISHSVNRSGLMMKRLIRLENNDPTWSNKLNKTVNLMEVNEVVEGLTPFPQSLPPPPRVARLIPSSLPPPTTTTTTATGSFNVYEYFWRKKPSVASIIDPVTQQGKKNSSVKAYEQQELVVMRGNRAGYLVPLLRGCKENRRSLLFWGPRYIATS